MPDNIITKEKLKAYFSITQEALDQVKDKLNSEQKEMAEDFLDMASRYYSDAKHFSEKGDYVNAFAALNYAHGWLDAGARSRLFLVNDSRLFTVDDE
ncbi:MAG: DUF357 domain-containing protein [archaeon]|nr:DUF357 domain-containing protein [Nanoarchaeota archaeon]